MHLVADETGEYDLARSEGLAEMWSSYRRTHCRSLRQGGREVGRFGVVEGHMRSVITGSVQGHVDVTKAGL